MTHLDMFLSETGVVVRTINLIPVKHPDTKEEHVVYRNVHPWGYTDYVLPHDEFWRRHVPLNEGNCPEHRLHDSGLPECNLCGKSMK